MGQSRGLKLPIAAHTNPSTHRLLHQAVAQFRVRFTLQAPTAAAKALCNQAGWAGGNASWTAAPPANALWQRDRGGWAGMPPGLPQQRPMRFGTNTRSDKGGNKRG